MSNHDRTYSFGHSRKRAIMAEGWVTVAYNHRSICFKRILIGCTTIDRKCDAKNRLAPKKYSDNVADQHEMHQNGAHAATQGTICAELVRFSQQE